MRRCPITYDPCEGHYSPEGLKILSPKLTQLHDLPYRQSQQLELAVEYADKLSFSGVQPKLNARLNLKTGAFEIVRSGGRFILKLPHVLFGELPQNEDLTMHLAAFAKIEVPVHGMIFAVDGSLVYFVQRFDRVDGKKVSVEDCGQLAGLPKESKYDFSMEKLAEVLDTFCTFKAAEKAKLLRLTLFNFLVGNEDMHIKNFSLIHHEGVSKLAPAYDLVNSSIVMKAKEEIGLPLNGKKSNFKRADFLEYFGKQRLGLTDRVIEEILNDFRSCVGMWQELIARSFLSEERKEAYEKLLNERLKRLGPLLLL